MNSSVQAILTAVAVAGTGNLFAATLEDCLAVFRTDGFFAPCGLTDEERSDPAFAIDYWDETKSACRHDGPSWPYSESMTLTALANALQNGKNTKGTQK